VVLKENAPYSSPYFSYKIYYGLGGTLFIRGRGSKCIGTYLSMLIFLDTVISKLCSQANTGWDNKQENPAEPMNT